LDRIDRFLELRARGGLRRELHPISYRKNGKIVLKGKEYIDFSSNDYLGLAGHPRLVEAAKVALDRFGTGSSASRLLSGDLELHHRLEDETSRFKGKEAALVFNSGYQANLGLFSALYGKGDVIFSDRLNHASIVDGILLSQAAAFRFRHNDVNHLKGLLKKERKKFKNALIVTETIFSMDGDRPPLGDLVELKARYDCAIMVDEAHATGIYGPRGAGVVEEEGKVSEVDLIMGTFSKALGSFGGYLAGPTKVIDFLINRCRSFIYSTALPPGIIASSLEALKLVKEEPHRRTELLGRARYFRKRLKGMGFNVKGESQIVPLVTGENSKTINSAGTLQEKGWWVMPIRPPTVPKNEARLRFSLSFHQDLKTLERLLNDIKSYVKI